MDVVGPGIRPGPPPVAGKGLRRVAVELVADLKQKTARRCEYSQPVSVNLTLTSSEVRCASPALVGVTWRNRRSTPSRWAWPTLRALPACGPRRSVTGG